ncbi:MAG: hypothetical protein M1402_00590 [Candidatus Thermoplasmatota archaeon]|nr:hypothetical protein [Candidatus Thermoplasmatota archaeon]
MNILYLILEVIIDIAIITFPIYFASKLVSKHSSIGRAVIAAFLGPIVFLIFYSLVGYVLSAITSYFYIIALVIAFLVLIYFYSIIFETSFAGGVLISIISVIISYIIEVFLGHYVSVFKLSLDHLNLAIQMEKLLELSVFLP